MSDQKSEPKQVESALEGWSIRPATESDLSRLVEMEGRLHPAPWSEPNFRGELEKPYSRLVLYTDDETDEVISSYICYWVMMDECQIHNVVVDLPYRGLGLAKRLIRHALNEAMKSGAKRALLEVRKSNLPAIQLYQGLGFLITHIRKGFYSNGEDAYQMSLSLDGSDLFGKIFE